jgi:hypothetical protein
MVILFIKFIGLIILIYLIYKLIWFFISSSSIKKKMKHLVILILVYISMWLLFFTHNVILKQNCLWDLDDEIEDYKVSLGELPPRLNPPKVDYVLPPKSTSESHDQLRRVFERELKKRIEERETSRIWWFGNSFSECDRESWGRSPTGWMVILFPFNLEVYFMK